MKPVLIGLFSAGIAVLFLMFTVAQQLWEISVW